MTQLALKKSSGWRGKRVTLFGALVVGVVVLLGIVFVVGTSEAQATDKELTISMTSDTTVFNPYSPQFSRIGQFVLGPVMRIDSRGRLHPGVAAALVPEGDGRSWLITLRKGAKFSDGQPVTAEDLAASFNAYADQKIGSRYSGVLTSGKFQGARVVDGRQVRVSFEKPWVPARLYLAQLGVWPKKLVDRVKADPAEFHIRATELVGAGPYRIKDYESNRFAVLEPTGKGEVIQVRIQDDDAAFTSFREGSVDMAYAEPRRQALFGNVPGAVVLKYPYHEVISLAVNCRAGTVTHKYPELRRAVLLAVDAEAMRQLVAAAGSQPAKGNLFAGAQGGFNAPDAAKYAAEYDPDAANRLLDSKGFAVQGDFRTTPDGSALTLTVLTYNNITEYPALAKRIARDLSDKLKVRTKVLMPPSAEFEDVMYRKNEAVSWDLMIAEWPYHDEFEPSLADSVAAHSIPDSRAGTNGRNHIGLKDAKANDLTLQADTTLDEKRRRALFHDLHRRLLQLDAVKPLYFVQDSWVLSERIEGYAPDDPMIRVGIFNWPERFRLKMR